MMRGHYETFKTGPISAKQENPEPGEYRFSINIVVDEDLLKQTEQERASAAGEEPRSVEDVLKEEVGQWVVDANPAILQACIRRQWA